MHFTLLAGAAIVSSALAASVEINAVSPATLKAGGQATVKYSPTDATVTLILRQGASTNLATIGTLTNDATGGSAVVNIPGNVANGDDYTFEIDAAGANPNYWSQFAITGGVASTAAASSTAASSSAASSAASSGSVSAATTTSVLTLTTAASVSASSSAGSNHTISSAKLSTTGSATGKATATGSGSVPTGTGAASTIGSSPLALIFGAVAAMAYLG